MKTILIILVLALASCTTARCYPSKGSKDYAWTVEHVEYTGPGWVIYTHRFEKGVKIKKNSFPFVNRIAI